LDVVLPIFLTKQEAALHCELHFGVEALQPLMGLALGLANSAGDG